MYAFGAINFPLTAVLVVSYKYWLLYFHFYSVQWIFHFPQDLLFDPDYYTLIIKKYYI